MQEGRPSMVARVSAETSASAHLDEVCRWLIGRQGQPVRFDVKDLPAVGRGSRLRLALPIVAPRAVLCAAWLLEDVEAGACLLAGQLRFVAHPTRPDIRLSFSGHRETGMTTDLLRPRAEHAARQLLDVIAESIRRPFALVRADAV